MNKQDLECESITNDIKKELNKKNLTDTTKKWERKCPKCNDTIYHTNKINCDRLNRLQMICRKCVGESQRLYKTQCFERICVKCNKITIYKTRKSFNQAEKQNRLCFNCTPRQVCKEETKLKIGLKNRGKNNGMYGKTHTMEYRKILSQKLINNPLYKTSQGIQKMTLTLRKKYAEKLNNTGIKCPRFNPNACKFIDEYGRQNGYNFQHALNGGEVYFKNIGVWVDGYDREKNVIFEFDEKHHYDINNKLKEKDIKRMIDIKRELNGCKIIRYNERLNEIKEY